MIDLCNLSGSKFSRSVRATCCLCACEILTFLDRASSETLHSNFRNALSVYGINAFPPSSAYDLITVLESPQILERNYFTDNCRSEYFTPVLLERLFSLPTGYNY